jgi:hypothetical protein
VSPVRIPWWQLLIVALVGGALYLPTLSHHFYTHDGWNDVMLGELIIGGGSDWYENLLRLIPTLSFGLRAAFGLSTWAWHLPNLLLHSANIALVVALAIRIQDSRWAAMMAGLFFAVTPLLVHPVEWVGGSYDLFATFGVLGCLIAMLDNRLILASLLAIVALLSKESALMLPVAVAAVIVAAQGLPKDRKAWLTQLKRVTPILALALLCALFRAAQVSGASHDAMAGRSVALIGWSLFTEGLPAAGTASVAVLGHLVNLSEVAYAMGWYALILFGVLAVFRAEKRWKIVGLLIAAWAVLLPVLLIGMDHSLMLENPRYLYLSAALASPLLPIVLTHDRIPQRLALIIAAVVASLGGYYTMDGVEKTSRQSASVASVVETVSTLPSGSRVWVLSDFYDEATARFLMSQWLHIKRKVRAGYVMRGTWTTYRRAPAQSGDAAQDYFGPSSKRFDPSMVSAGDQLFVQSATTGKLQPALLKAVQKTGVWVTVEGALKAALPADPEDTPRQLDGQSITIQRFAGPVSGMELYPQIYVATLPGPAPITGLELTYSAEIHGQLRYGSGYHELWGAFLFGPDDAPVAVSFEIEATGKTQTVSLDLSFDPVAQSTVAGRLNLIALNYPGKLSIEKVRIRR